MTKLGKFSLAVGCVAAAALAVTSLQAAVPHDATFKALGQHQNHVSRTYRSYSAAPVVEQRSFSVAPGAAAPAADCAASPGDHVPAPPAPQAAAPQPQRTYSVAPSAPVYQNYSGNYRSYRSSTPAYALPRAMRQ